MEHQECAASLYAWRRRMLQRLQKHEKEVRGLQEEQDQLHRTERALRMEMSRFQDTARVCREMQLCIRDLLRDMDPLLKKEEEPLQAAWPSLLFCGAV